MATNKKLLLERMVVSEKHAQPQCSNAQKWALAETIALGLVIAFCIGLVLLLNALIPPNW